jgi:hypothetical protein
MSDESRRGRSSPHDAESESIALDRSLEEAAASLESARALLSLRKTVGRNLRVAIRCLLEAQDRIEVEGPSSAARLDLLESIRLIGAVEQELKGNISAPLPNGVTAIEADPQNRRAFQRLPANLQIQLEPEHRAQRQDIAGLPLDGMTVNVSRGGMLAKIDQGILRHGRYLIRFLEAGGAIQPAVTWGAVRRSRARNRGWEVGIEFDDPLETIN